MTVAIAALCSHPNNQFIIAAADQMITAGDIQFEQPQPKMWQFGQASFAMLYGLSAAQAEVASEVWEHTRANGLTDVKKIAQVYLRLLGDYVRRRAEADVLSPLGLTSFDLIRRPPTVNPTQLKSLSHQMQSYFDGSGLAEDLGGAIIAGVDDRGPHIYGVEYGRLTSYDSIGFVAAGGGQWHANSQMMFAGYTRAWDFAHALSLVYAAKKRAEVAPGVGTQTDIVIVGMKPPSLIHLNPDNELMLALDDIYREHKTKIDADLVSQHRSVKALFDDLLKKAAEQQAAQQTAQPTTQTAAHPVSEGEQPAPEPPRHGRRRRPPSRGSRGA